MRIYTDGSTYPKNPGNGGGAFLAIGNQYNYVQSWFLGENLTNNQAELLAISGAVDMALEYNIKTLTILTDSQYCLFGIRRIYGKKELLTSNSPLWEELARKIRKHSVKIIPILIEGHSGIKENTLVDRLAYLATDNKTTYNEFVPKDDFDSFTETIKEEKTRRRRENKNAGK